MAVTLEIDHLVVAADRLADGVAYVEQSLGLRMQPGGKHPDMGTHNALLNLGPIYLEVIAIDPNAPAPDHPRWFNLDHFSGPPRLTNWVARTDDLDAAIALAPPGIGTRRDLRRGDLSWSMVVPDDGMLPFDQAFPGLIQWHGDAHPLQRLAEPQCRMEMLQIAHPDPEDLRDALNLFDGGLGALVGQADQTSFRAAITTMSGLNVLT